MEADHSWPVRVAAAGPVAVGTTLWRYQGQLSVTVIVKATFRLVADGVMTVSAPEPIRIADEYVGDIPLRSMSGVRETAPMLQDADVLLFGYAYAPREPGAARTPVAETTVRLAVGRADTTLLDKSIRVVGDREGDEPSVAFDRIPLRYERALGGVGSVDNPLGVGALASADQPANLLSVVDPFGAVACYGPLPPFFPARERLRGSCSMGSLHAEPVEIGRDFDWAYFQAAPADQRLDVLHGDEWLELRGLCPEQDHVGCAFPGARAVTEVFADDDTNVPTSILLRGDMLIIEPEERRCSLLWRGSCPLANQAVADSVIIVAGLELPGRPVLWPGSPEEALALSAPPAQGAPITVAISDDDRTATIGDPPRPDVDLDNDFEEADPGPVKTTLLDASGLASLQQVISSAQERHAAPPEPPAAERQQALSMVNSEDLPVPLQGDPLPDPLVTGGEPPDPDDDVETTVREEDIATDVVGTELGGADADPEADIATAAIAALEHQLVADQSFEDAEVLRTEIMPESATDDDE